MDREEKIKKAAKEYAKGINRIGEESICVSDAEAFEDGIKWADAHPKSPWISVEDKTPEDGECVYVIPQHKLLCWNEYYGVWDDEEGDDCYCKKDDVTHWTPIPEFEI